MPVSSGVAVALWPLVAYFALIVVMTFGIVAFSYVLGQRHRERATGQPYESGIVPTGSARLTFANEFYLIAMFFVVIDLESVFVFAWAVAARELGWAGYVGLVVFVATLAVALVYLGRQGALDWGTTEFLKRSKADKAGRRDNGVVRR